MTVEERVAAGAAWLDENRPGWERRIDLAELSLRSTCRCVLGQLFGNYYSATDHYMDIRPASFGFTVFEPDFDTDRWPTWPKDEYAALDEAWIALLKERFDSGLLSDA